MFLFYLDSPLVASLIDVNAMVLIIDKHKMPYAVHIQLHQAKNEQPQGEKIQKHELMRTSLRVLIVILEP